MNILNLTFQGGPHEHDPRLGRGNLRERRFLRDLRRAGDTGEEKTCFAAFFTFCVFLARCGRTTCLPAPCTSQTRRTCAARTPRAGVINAYISILCIWGIADAILLFISQDPAPPPAAPRLRRPMGGQQRERGGARRQLVLVHFPTKKGLTNKKKFLLTGTGQPTTTAPTQVGIFLHIFCFPICVFYL